MVGREQQAMVGAVEGFGGETGDVPLHQPCGGPAICLSGGRARALPRDHAHAGKVLGLPDPLLLLSLIHI